MANEGVVDLHEFGVQFGLIIVKDSHSMSAQQSNIQNWSLFTPRCLVH
jgi:hypothetical protein